MNKKLLWFLVIPLFMFNGCRESFTPEWNNYQDLLVVDGMVTSEPGPYTIRVSRTSDIGKPDYKPLAGCEVTIHEEGNSYEILQETKPGTYKTSEDGIQGKVGESYRLSIITPGGSEYKSEPVKMKSEVGIDEINAELQFHETNEYPRPMGGYQFFVSSQSAGEDVNLLWRLSETYEYTSEFTIDYIYRGKGIEEYNNSDTLYRCWKTQKLNDFFVGSTRSLTGSQITNKPLHFVNTETKRLQVRYSLLVKQYHINNEAYSYWKEVREQVSNEDFLFSSQPFQILGNIKNVDKPDEAVFGFFTVASVSKKRMFIDRPLNTEFFYSTCIPDTDLRALGYMGPNDFPVYLTDSPEGIALGSDYCFDCTLWNGKLSKPDFWVEAK